MQVTLAQMTERQEPRLPGDGPAIKRRKVRKGTQSCWECKRRKVRCLFAVPSNTICDNCTRRKTACISQEYVDGVQDVPKKRNEVGVEARLGRVEDVLEQLLQRADTTRSPRPVDSHEQAQSETNDLSPQNDIGEATVLQSDAVLTPASILHFQGTSLVRSYTGLAQDLVKAWPSHEDLAHIYQLPINFSTHSHMRLCMPSSARPSCDPISTRQMLQLPPPGCHPVLVARKLLFLGSLLQGAVSTPKAPFPLRKRFGEIMTHAVDIATRLVTTDDTLTAFVEGVECIMIEAMIHNYAGNLHRAWMAVRRASAVALTLGLHRGFKVPAHKILDPETKDGFDSDGFCFRIVEMDRYLSVTLGLPQSSLETRALRSESLAKCEPIDRMARLQCIIAGRMLRYDVLLSSERTAGSLNDIETLLQQAASEMSPQWWLVPDLASCGEDDNALDPFQDVTRINYQFSHYHLIMRLHLPYILGSAEHAHSKIAASNAGRETLSRYIAFRRWNPGHFYCRGIDYVAFIALTVLCIAHIDSSSTPTQNAPSSTDVGKLLAQSHLSDRGMMERTLDILKRMSKDAIASKLARIIEYLLDVEADAAKGVYYSAIAAENDGQTGYDGDLERGGKTLQLHIPYFGTIDLHRRLAPKSSGAETSPQSPELGVASTISVQPGQQSSMQWNAQSPQSPLLLQGDPHLSSNSLGPSDDLDSMHDLYALNDWTLQTINASLFTSLFGDVEDQDVAGDIGISPYQLGSAFYDT